MADIGIPFIKPGFPDQVAEVLKQRGIVTHESKEDIALKTEAKKAISGEMFNKRMPLDASTIKANIVRGIGDRAIPQREFAEIAKQKREEVAARTLVEYPHHIDKKPKQKVAPPLPSNYVPVDQRQHQRNPLGANLVRDPQLDILNNEQNGRVREFAVQGTHNFSFSFPKHEVEKWGVGVDRIQRALAQAT